MGLKKNILVCFFIFASLAFSAFAQEPGRAKALDVAALKQKIEKNNADSLPALEDLLDIYFANNNYEEGYPVPRVPCKKWVR